MKSLRGEFTQKFGLKVRFERAKQKLSQEELAAMANLSSNTLCSIENGTSTPSIETANAIAKALAIPIYELINVDKLEL